MSNDEKSRFSLYILKKDIFKVPCFRESMLYSISSWIGVGLLTFLFTSRPAFSSHCGFASYMLVSFGYFTHCRLKFRNDMILRDQYEEIIYRTNVLEDTNSNDDSKFKIPVVEDA